MSCLFRDESGRFKKDERSLKEIFSNSYKVTETGCWIWTGNTDLNGYGRVWYGGKAGKTFKAHRLSAFLFKNVPFQSRKFVCHHCDNPSCVNPAHLFVGMHKDNMRDMARKKRSMRHELNVKAKLSELDVQQIRREYIPKRGEKSRLARKYNVTLTNIRFILCGRTWKN